MTKVKGVALAAFRAQIAGGDTEPVHPDVIKIHNQQVPVSLGFETSWRVGTTSRLWREGDAILFEADLDDDALAYALAEKTRADKRVEENKRPYSLADFDTAAIGYTLEVKDSQGRAIKGGTIFEIGLVEPEMNMNKGQPRLEIE